MDHALVLIRNYLKIKQDIKMKVPESVLKKQAAQQKIAEAKAVADAEAAKKAITDVEDAKKKAAAYEAEYAKADKELVDNRRLAKVDGGFYVPAQPKVALIIRILGIIGVSPKAKKVMQLFRLRQLHNCTFVRLMNARFGCYV